MISMDKKYVKLNIFCAKVIATATIVEQQRKIFNFLFRAFP